MYSFNLQELFIFGGGINEMATTTDITTMQQLAEHYGGKCLSKEYIDEHSLLEWMCEKGHRWESPYKVVNQGAWCKQCLKKRKTREEILEELKQIAKDKGGECLTKEFPKDSRNVACICKNGHIWVIKAETLKEGGWCRTCITDDISKQQLEELNEIAAKKGGKCLAEKYINNSTRLNFSCENDHVWETNAAIIKRGGWCPECAQEKISKEQIAIVKSIAIQKGGKYISGNYIKNTSKLKFECAKGHNFFVTTHNIKGGQWCRECVLESLRDSIDVFHKIASEKGGKCLSSEYKSSKDKLEFECAEGHRWKTAAGTIKSGCWCSVCGHKQAGLTRRGPLEPFYKIAASHNGKCISFEYKNSRYIYLVFECSEGHRWKASGANVKNGSWCPKCADKKKGERSRHTIEMYQEIAELKGGKCLSSEYVNSKSKLKFECGLGHKWAAIPNTIKMGNWCPKCGKLKLAEKYRDSIEIYHTIATEKGGKCLSTEYKNMNSRIKMECAEGHVWETQAHGIKMGTWCPKCAIKKAAERQRDSIETYYKIAAGNNGKCLSSDYKNNHSRLLFECANGHRWTDIASKIKGGKWCTKCNGKKIGRKTTVTIERYITIAAEHNGKCLSNEYVNHKTVLEFECSQGHIWKTKASVVSTGAWCPQCYDKTRGEATRGSIETYQQIAADNGGKCLSAAYINLETKLQFVCSNGHQWQAAPYSIKRGVWCKVCKENEKKKRKEDA